MSTQVAAQKIPASGSEREALRERGQFWTPDWIAEPMAAYCLADGGEEIFDPAVGAGAFFLAAKSVAQQAGNHVNLFGTEIDPQALQQAESHGLTKRDLANVALTDFVLRPPARRFVAIVANPPYIRHHRLSQAVKAQLRALSLELLGKSLDGRAGCTFTFCCAHCNR